MQIIIVIIIIIVKIIVTKIAHTLVELTCYVPDTFLRAFHILTAYDNSVVLPFFYLFACFVFQVLLFKFPSYG